VHLSQVSRVRRQKIRNPAALDRACSTGFGEGRIFFDWCFVNRTSPFSNYQYNGQDADGCSLPSFYYHSLLLFDVAIGVQLTPLFSCKHVTTIAAKPHPKSACLLQRSLDVNGAEKWSFISKTATIPCAP